MAVKYHSAVDTITAERSLSLHRYEISDEAWNVINDLISVLKDHYGASSKIEAQIFPTEQIEGGMDYHGSRGGSGGMGERLSNFAAADDVTMDFGDIAMEGIDDQDELESYLAQPIKNVSDPIQWWYNHHAAFLTLSKMASTSTAVEHVFSQGQQLLYYTRNCLSPASIRALMCLGHWSQKDLVTSAEVVEAIKRRHQDDNEDDKE
ncbi:hypothetical protein H0H92_006319 [Tricholoma furcatifolium]|nr:hypothetical protein H0H92_006319 [Tricholoma furcatifolium]